MNRTFGRPCARTGRGRERGRGRSRRDAEKVAAAQLIGHELPRASDRKRILLRDPRKREPAARSFSNLLADVIWHSERCAIIRASRTVGRNNTRGRLPAARSAHLGGGHNGYYVESGRRIGCAGSDLGGARAKRGDRHRERFEEHGRRRPELRHLLRLGRQLQLGPEQQRELSVAARQRQRLSAHDRLHETRAVVDGQTYCRARHGRPGGARHRPRRTFRARTRRGRSSSRSGYRRGASSKARSSTTRRRGGARSTASS